jgi:hypothetical protein
MRRRAAPPVLPVLFAALLAVLLAGCRITPDEIERIEAENELLREQIQKVRENCEYYRDLEVRPDDTAAGPAPGPVPEE